jgi:hypothetical protein
VKDANGALVGLLDPLMCQGTSCSPVVGGGVHRNLGSAIVQFGVSADGTTLVPSDSSSTYSVDFLYQSSDCSGTPLGAPGHQVVGTVGGMMFVQTVEGPARGLYYALPNEAGTYSVGSYNYDARIHATSQSDCTGGCFFAPPDQCCCPTTLGPGPWSPMHMIDKSGAALGLVPPFHVEGP